MQNRRAVELRECTETTARLVRCIKAVKLQREGRRRKLRGRHRAGLRNCRDRIARSLSCFIRRGDTATTHTNAMDCLHHQMLMTADRLSAWPRAPLRRPESAESHRSTPLLPCLAPQAPLVPCPAPPPVRSVAGKARQVDRHSPILEARRRAPREAGGWAMGWARRTFVGIRASSCLRALLFVGPG